MRFIYSYKNQRKILPILVPCSKYENYVMLWFSLDYQIDLLAYLLSELSGLWSVCFSLWIFLLMDCWLLQNLCFSRYLPVLMWISLKMSLTKVLQWARVCLDLCWKGTIKSVYKYVRRLQFDKIYRRTWFSLIWIFYISYAKCCNSNYDTIQDIRFVSGRTLSNENKDFKLIAKRDVLLPKEIIRWLLLQWTKQNLRIVMSLCILAWKNGLTIWVLQSST